MAKMKDFFQARMKIDWLSDDELNAYATEWSRPGRLNGMINWYRASPLKIADPGQPVTDLPALPVEKLQVRCPHLLIWGMEDRALLPASNTGLEDYAPDLTRVEIPGADHWLHHQKPQEVAQAILDWVD